ncbi:CALK protein [Ostreococcus tauri]|uniref:CALK protein n=1 Tax=Ostreococcus tauri TaxID=70448 RepID=A0A1Y5IE05_OSTTA|nr:CALK protein [Ostreococcus tauri]
MEEESEGGADAKTPSEAVAEERKWTPTLVGDLRASRLMVRGGEDAGSSGRWSASTSEDLEWDERSGSRVAALETLREDVGDDDLLGMTDPDEVTSVGSGGWRYRLDDFQLVEVIGRGRYSVVYEAVYRRMNTRVALKCYIKDKLKAHVFEQIAHEIAVYSRLKHPNIAAFHGSFVDPETGNYYIVHECMRRGDVFNALARTGGKFSERRAVSMVLKPVIEAIRYLHQNRVVHRDLKPENVLLTEDGSSKLIDFGFALHLDWYKPLGRLGTTDYMAPEVVKCDKAYRDANAKLSKEGYGEAIDYWSIGCFAYELIVGFPPFQSTSRESIYSLITARHFRVPAFVSEEASDFIHKCLVLEPGERIKPREMLKHPWIVANSTLEDEGVESLERSCVHEEIGTPTRSATARSMVLRSLQSVSSKFSNTRITPQALDSLREELDWQYASRPSLERGEIDRSSEAFTTSTSTVEGVDIVRARSFSLSHRLRRFGSTFAFRFRNRD